MTTRNRNRGLRKICGCPRRTWAKCPHSWHFNFKPKGGPAFRFSVDTEAGKHIEAKGDAEALADKWRDAIREGTFRRRGDAPVTFESSNPVLTLASFGERYFERRGKPASNDERGRLKQLAAFQGLGSKALTAITEDDIEAFFADLRARGRAASTRNHYTQLAKALFRWATRKGYLERNPIGETDTLKREKHAKRDRRLEPDILNEEGKVERDGEESRLIAVASPSLQRLIIAAIEACCRRGELLALQWRDVDLQKRELVVRAEDEGARKTGAGRRLPISGRLAAVLEMARTANWSTIQGGPGKGLGEAHQTAMLGRWYVFGDEGGRKIGSTKRAWETAVLKAHGHTPEWATGGKLAATSRAALDAIDLHFHDLRHEGGSRLLEAGWPLHHVQHMLGHASVAQTATYLNATKYGLQESMQRLDASRCKTVASTPGIEHRPVRNEQPKAISQELVN
jgi:integrase